MTACVIEIYIYIYIYILINDRDYVRSRYKVRSNELQI